MPLLFAAGAVLLVVAVIFAKLAPQHAATGALVPQRRAVAGAALALLAVAGAGFAPRFLQGPRLRPMAVSVLLALVVTGELFWQGRRLYRLARPRSSIPRPRWCSSSRKRRAPFGRSERARFSIPAPTSSRDSRTCEATTRSRGGTT